MMLLKDISIPMDTPSVASSDPATGFAQDDGGSMTILALFLFICMVIIGGISIDIMVFENNRTRLQNLADRAALAAADLDQTVPAAQIVQSYFEKEGMEDYLKTVQVSEAVNQRSVTIETEKLQKTMFLNFWNHTGVDTLTPHSRSTATEALTDIEISLVLDVSGSMGWASSAPGSTSKINDLKSAAKRFIDKIYTGDDPDRITVSLVPYSTQVNAGPVVMGALAVPPTHAYSNCLDFKAADFDTTTVSGGGAYVQTSHFNQWDSNQQPNRFVCRPENNSRIKPVMNNPAAIKAEIDTLVAEGNTSIEIGLKWGAAFLDPSARPLTQALINDGQVAAPYASRPYDWDRAATEKFVVVLTDGINTEQNEISPAYASGPSGVYRWRPDLGASLVLYSYNSPEVGDEDGDGISDEGYWHPQITLPRWLTGLSSNITIPKGWTDVPFGADLAAIHPALVAALPSSQPPVQVDYADLWGEMNVRHFAEKYIRAMRNSTTARNNFYDAVWSGIAAWRKDQRLLGLCDDVRTKGATIFTIGFEVTDHSANVMRQCASTPNYFIRVVGNDLEAAFDQIANSISKLRLTQ